MSSIISDTCCTLKNHNFNVKYHSPRIIAWFLLWFLCLYSALHFKQHSWISGRRLHKRDHCCLFINSTVVVSEYSFRVFLRNECPVGSGHSASPAAEKGLCCCLAVFTWAKQMVVSSYLCSYTPPVQKAPFFSWKRLANDCGGRCMTLMTSVALQPTVRQKLILKIQTVCLETVRCFL